MNCKYVWLYECLSVGGDATWIIVQWVKTSLSSLSSPHSVSQKDVDHIRCDIGLVLRNAPYSLTWTQMSLFHYPWREQAKISSAKRAQEIPSFRKFHPSWSPSQALLSCFPLGNFIGSNFFFFLLSGLPKEPLDESEREEWKSWLKAQHSEN